MRPLLFLSAALALAVTACRPAPVKPAATPGAVVVSVVKAEWTATATVVPISGLVQASRQGTVAAQVMGDVVAVPVQLGASVAAGDVLVRLSSGELDARLAQAKATQNEAARAHAQEVELLAKGAATRAAVADLQDRLSAAQANFGALQAVVDHLTIRAPFAGVIGGKFVEVGDLAVPGRVLVEVHAHGPLEIETGLPAAFSLLPLGAEVAFEHAGQEGRARVKESAAAAGTQTLDRRVLLTVTTGTLTAGQAVTVFWPGEARRRILIPVTALQRHGQLERVWVVDAQRQLTLRLVRSAGTEGNRLEIAAGLQGGEEIVDAPVSGLVEGAPVTTK
jgi:RND family efflux transporter MFP subunit